MAHHVSNPSNPVAFISACLRPASRAEIPITVPHTHSDSSTAAPRIEILTIGVHPEFQQRGLASLLVRRTLEHFREGSALSGGTMIHANVATSNLPALSFYKRMGMRIASDVIHNLYRTCSYGSRDAYSVAGYIFLET